MLSCPTTLDLSWDIQKNIDDTFDPSPPSSHVPCLHWHFSAAYSQTSHIFLTHAYSTSKIHSWPPPLWWQIPFTAWIPAHSLTTPFTSQSPKIVLCLLTYSPQPVVVLLTTPWTVPWTRPALGHASLSHPLAMPLPRLNPSYFNVITVGFYSTLPLFN